MSPARCSFLGIPGRTKKLMTARLLILLSASKRISHSLRYPAMKCVKLGLDSLFAVGNSGDQYDCQSFCSLIFTWPLAYIPHYYYPCFFKAEIRTYSCV